MIITYLAICVSILVITIIITILIYKFGHRSKFAVQPEQIYDAKELLQQPNQFDAFRDKVCGTNSQCRKKVDAVVYLDSKHLLNDGNFNIENISRII